MTLQIPLILCLSLTFAFAQITQVPVIGPPNELSSEFCQNQRHYDFNSPVFSQEAEVNVGASTTRGVHGKALHFDGNLNHVELPYGNFSKEQGSIEYWFKPADINSTHGLLSIYNNDQDRFSMSIDEGYIHFAVGYPHKVVRGKLNCQSGQWQHIVLTYDFLNSDFVLYQNGIIIDEKHGQQFKMLQVMPNVIHIGTSYDVEDHDQDGTQYDYRFHGSMDEVIFYGCPITPEQVNTNFNHGLSVLGDAVDVPCSHPEMAADSLPMVLEESPVPPVCKCMEIPGLPGKIEVIALQPEVELSPESIIDVTLFPNPTRYDLNYKIDMATTENIFITITDLSGKIVFTDSFSPSMNIEGTIELNHIANGTYLFTFLSGERKIVKRFAKL